MTSFIPASDHRTKMLLPKLVWPVKAAGLVNFKDHIHLDLQSSSLIRPDQSGLGLQRGRKPISRNFPWKVRPETFHLIGIRANYQECMVIHRKFGLIYPTCNPYKNKCKHFVREGGWVHIATPAFLMHIDTL